LANEDGILWLKNNIRTHKNTIG